MRPKGRLNDKTLQIQRFCRSIVEDPEYKQTLLNRARAGNLGSMEPVLFAYGYGKPKERVEDNEEDLNALSLDELMVRLDALRMQLIEARSIDRMLGPYTPTPPKVIDVAPVRSAYLQKLTKGGKTE